MPGDGAVHREGVGKQILRFRLDALRGFLVKIAERIGTLARLAIKREGADKIAAAQFEAGLVKVGIGDEILLVDAVDFDSAAVIGFERVVFGVGGVERDGVDDVIAQGEFIARREIAVLEPHKAERRVEDGCAGVDRRSAEAIEAQAGEQMQPFMEGNVADGEESKIGCLRREIGVPADPVRLLRKRIVENVAACRPNAQVAAIDGEITGKKCLPCFVVIGPPGNPGEGVDSHRPGADVEGVACAQFIDVRNILRRKAIADIEVAIHGVEKRLQAQRVVAERPCEIGVGGERLRIGDVFVGDVDGARIERRRSDAVVEGESGRGEDAEIDELADVGGSEERSDRSVDLVRRQLAVAVKIGEIDIAAGDVGSVVDQLLRDAVPADGLLVALRGEIGAADLRLEIIAGEGEGGLRQRALRRDSAVETVRVLVFGVGVNAGFIAAEIEAEAGVAANDALVVRPRRRAECEEMPVGADLFRGARRQRRDVKKAADAPRAVDRRRRALDDFDAFAGAQRRRKRAGIFNALEAAKISVGAIAAQRDRTRHAEEAPCEGSRREGGEVVHGLDGKPFDQRVGDDVHRARRVGVREVEPHHRAAVLKLDQFQRIGADDDFVNGCLRQRACRKRRR